MYGFGFEYPAVLRRLFEGVVNIDLWRTILGCMIDNNVMIAVYLTMLLILTEPFA